MNTYRACSSIDFSSAPNRMPFFSATQPNLAAVFFLPVEPSGYFAAEEILLLGAWGE